MGLILANGTSHWVPMNSFTTE